jgi:CxxC-x17-CxxC domain-containing protein
VLQSIRSLVKFSVLQVQREAAKKAPSAATGCAVLKLGATLGRMAACRAQTKLEFQKLLHLTACSQGTWVLDTKESLEPQIRIEKPSSRPTKDVRSKTCATCERPFSVEAGQKYFDCPECYQKKMSAARSRKAKESKVLTQILCASCGAVEFVRFVPDDPKTVLCRPCFVKQAKEQKKK